MTAHLVWITGRAAAGKSTLITELSTQLQARNLIATTYVDETILLDLVRADTDHVHHWHPERTHRIAFRSGRLFDDSLRVLNGHLLSELDRGGLAIVELARGQHHPPVDVTYRRALDLLDPRLWPHSTVFRLDVDFTAQLHRNTTRSTGTRHGTPDDIMHTLYRDDDPTAFTDAGIPVTTLPASAPPRANAAQVLTAIRPGPDH